jgi:hypothetical protein
VAAAKTLICPTCRSKYRAGVKTCEKCGRLLVQTSHLHVARPLADSIHEVTVANYQGQPEAEMWAELLRNEGIPAAVIQLLPGARLAWGMVPCNLRVRSTDVERARTVLGLDH